MSGHNSNLPFDSDPRDLPPRHVDDQLAAYTSGECSEIERATVERHLNTCAACCAVLDETRRIRALLAPLATQATPTSVVDSVLARLAATTGDTSAAPCLAEIAPSDGAPERTGCPVSPADDVSLSVARLEPRHHRNRTSSSWRHPEGALERGISAMKRQTSTNTQIATQPASGGRLRSFMAVAAAVALVVLGVGVFGLMSHRTSQGPGGQPVKVGQNIPVHLPANSTLDGILMDSANDGWAVGTVFNAPNGMGGSKNAQLAHYDGNGWTTSLDSASFKQGMLISISMVSANDGWAVGSVDSNPIRGLLLHYTGGHWHEVDIASTGFAGGGTLHMVSANEGWLYAPVGAKASADHKTLVIHYLNGTWRLFSSLPGWAVVSMLSTSDGWALVQVEQTVSLIQRYQDGKWNLMGKVDNASLMTMVSPTEGWMAGTYDSGHIPYVGHFDGHLLGDGWSEANLPDNAPAEVDQIAVAAPGDIWIFGRTDTNTQAPKTVAWHYRMGQWTRVDLDFQASPTGVSMASPDSGWATGNHGNSAALLRYDQGTWTAVYYGK